MWTQSPNFAGSLAASPLETPFVDPPDTPRASFLSHFIDNAHLRDSDPLLASLSSKDLNRFKERITADAQSFIVHEQVIHAPEGRAAVLEVRGFPLTSRFFERALRTRDLSALEKVHKAAADAATRGAKFIGLDQFTSIVTDNGTLLADLVEAGSRITTGNSLTVGVALVSLQRLAQERGLQLRDMHVAVVGVAGNICNVNAQLLADEARELTLVHHEPYDTSVRFQRAVQLVLDNSRTSCDKLHPTNDMDALLACDAVVCGTNSTGRLLLPRHLKRGAIVLDISVPTNVHPSVLSTRPDVECFQGGFVRLPLGQRLFTHLVPVPEGETFACMAETLVTALVNHPGCPSFHTLTKERVRLALQPAQHAGFAPGSLKRMSPFEEKEDDDAPPAKL